MGILGTAHFYFHYESLTEEQIQEIVDYCISVACGNYFDEYGGPGYYIYEGKGPDSWENDLIYLAKKYNIKIDYDWSSDFEVDSCRITPTYEEDKKYYELKEKYDKKKKDFNILYKKYQELKKLLKN